MNRTQVGLFAVVVLLTAALVWLVVSSRRGPQPQGTVVVNAGRVRLGVVSPKGENVPSGRLVVQTGDPVDLRVTLEDKAFIYLFDEFDNQTLLMWAHTDAAAWDKGEYAADPPSFASPGEHRLVVVASPTRQAEAEKWKVITSDSMSVTCPNCEVGDYVLTVNGPSVKAASPAPEPKPVPKPAPAPNPAPKPAPGPKRQP